jgi:hypothetical protein
MRDRTGALILALFVIAAALAFWLLLPPPVTIPCNGCGGPGTTLAIETPTESTTGGNHLYNFSVESAGGGITWNDVTFFILTSTGDGVATTGPGWNLTILSFLGHHIAFYALGPGVADWISGGNLAVSSQQSIQLTSPASLSLVGDVLELVGSGSFQGSIDVAIPG